MQRIAISLLLLAAPTAHAASPMCQGIDPALNCESLFAPIPPPTKIITKVGKVKHAKVAHSDMLDIEFTGVVLEDVTLAWLAKAKAKYAGRFSKLAELERANGFPEGTLRTMWVIESMCGELNIRNKSNHDGHFQFGEFEQKKFNLTNPFDFDQASNAVPKLLKDYHDQFHVYSKAPVAWSKRSMADWYMLHQQGFMGSATQYNAVMFGDKLLPRVRKNIEGNVARQYRKAISPGISDRDLTIFFYRMWEHEMDRIWSAIK